MSVSPNASLPNSGLLDEETIDRQPQREFDAASSTESGAGIGVGLVQGSFASLSHANHSLRRRRLGSAALFLTAVYSVLFMWSLLGDGTGQWIISMLMFLRFAVAALCAAVIVSNISLTPGQVRGLEYLLFGSFTLILIVIQYTVNLELMRQEDIPRLIAHMKNGVLGMFALMVVYGMLIPNDPRRTAGVVLTMALAVLIGMDLLFEREDVAAVAEQLHTSVHVGTNALFLMIGAALAIYGSYVLNGLRSDLHEAKKFGQYQLREKLGVGGMGEVYLAEHQLLKRPCALKLIKPEAGDDPIALARFEREVQSAARLAHPNTIEIYDYGRTDEGTFYYVMEYLEGLSLQDLAAKFGPLPLGRVIYLLQQVCAGLSEAHFLGLVHRDLKPANVFIAVRGGEADVVKVLDFGLVKVTQDENAVELTGEQNINGTPLYMAPEQVTCERSLDPRADIYALGCVMYFLLIGQPPFRGRSAFEVMMAHAHDPVVPPSQVRPGVPADLEQVVLQCLSKKPDARYPSVIALKKALAACASAADWDASKAQEWWTAVNLPMRANKRPATQT
jgi:eukaryotic-like serine/threonine-protein kinase